MQIVKLSNTIQPYDWGSTELIPKYLGIENRDDMPMAELWMGAHPKAPSRVEGSADTLLDRIKKHPKQTVGESAQSRFGAQLPFLFKVLAAERGLSIQAHPNLEQARAGYAREEAAGIDRDAPHRNYRDDNHKPEIICALSEFWALCGFRPVRDIASEFREEGFAELRHEVADLESADGLRRFFEALMRANGEVRRSLIDAGVERARARTTDAETDRYAWVLELHRQFGEDIGVLAPLYLNCIRLQPNQALFLSAGVLHAYLRGIGIELMANSDNVLRGGCTRKHVDVDELLSVLTFEAGEPHVQAGSRVSSVEVQYESDVAEFRLSRLALDGSVPRAIELGAGPEIILCVAGDLVVRDADGTERALQRGESLFVPATSERLAIIGRGRLFRARVPV